MRSTEQEIESIREARRILLLASNGVGYSSPAFSKLAGAWQYLDKTYIHPHEAALLADDGEATA